MIYLSDTFFHPGLFQAGEFDIHVRDVDVWAVRHGLARREDETISAVRDPRAADAMTKALGREIRISDEGVYLTPDDVLYVGTSARDNGMTWRIVTVSPYWRDE